MDLFPAPAEPPATQEVLVPAEEVDTTAKAKSRPARRPLPSSLETVVRRIEPAAADKVCPQCGVERYEIGSERCERAEHIPASLIRDEVVRPKLACKKCPEAGIAIAPVPPAVVEKGSYGAGLIAQAVSGKYDDHLPLARQSKQFERLGLVTPRQTLCDLVGKAADLLHGVVAEMKRELPGSGSVPVDESRFGCWTRRSMNAAHKVASGCWANRVATWFSSLTRAGAGNTRKSCSMGIGEFLSATDMASSER